MTMEEIDKERLKANACLSISRNDKIAPELQAYWRERHDAIADHIGQMIAEYHSIRPTTPSDGINVNPEE